MRNEIILLVIAMVAYGCLYSPSSSATFCSKVKENIAEDFGMFGNLMEESGTNSQGSRYCEYYIGKTKVLQIMFSEEPDSERAYYDAYGGIKLNKKSEEQVIESRKNEGGEIKSFYISMANRRTGEIKYYSGAFGSSNSVTACASYVPGYPNPFVTDIRMIEKIAINALGIGNN